MKTVHIRGAHDVRVENGAAPTLLTGPSASGRDALVRVVASCVCGSDLWTYRGFRPPAHDRGMGHEFVGIVEQVGASVRTVCPGDFVIAPFYIADGTCVLCRAGFSAHCLHGSLWGADIENEGASAGTQTELVRVPLADGTLFPVPADAVNDDLLPGLLTLSDVMGTGHHAAICAGVTPGSTVAVVGDGAVGLCAIIAAKRLGAERIVAMSRHPNRQALAAKFGATDIIPERGDDGIARLKDMFEGVGPQFALECVGTKESMSQAIRAVRPGGNVGFVGVPVTGGEISVRELFVSNVGIRGGIATVRDYMAELLPEVLDGRIEPGRVFDQELPLTEAPRAYALMDQRQAIKVMLRA
ncbi:IMP dehydrogenase [Mycobacterium sp. MS1601]|uniref:zinc-binding dehydrogenase n=1 Tax=Mycobacterium sp. MS1601 TaxID=1936029 RepID=UPI00097923AC|nr:zinc-binding dehydrogenase [Mycobacterium sp. MS1601]AQA05079.1 IMP dehydrogenase [Mycobacterium sp. MS1601]